MNNFPRKLGKKPAKIDTRTLKLSKYLKEVTAPVPEPPDNLDYAELITNSIGWPVYLNDQIGDCVPAAMAHQIEQWTYLAKGEANRTALSNQQVLWLYEKLGGYIPGNPLTDNGVVMLDALRYWRNAGVFGNKIQAFASVDLTNYTEVRQAIWLFGNIFLGIQLPLSAQQGDMWTVPVDGPIGDGAPGSWGGHCVPVTAYHVRPNPTSDVANRKTYTVITWGQAMKMSHNFMTTYGDEAYVLLDLGWLQSSGKSVGGFDLGTLQNDLRNL